MEHIVPSGSKNPPLIQKSPSSHFILFTYVLRNPFGTIQVHEIVGISTVNSFSLRIPHHSTLSQTFILQTPLYNTFSLPFTFSTQLILKSRLPRSPTTFDSLYMMRLITLQNRPHFFLKYTTTTAYPLLTIRIIIVRSPSEHGLPAGRTSLTINFSV